MENNCIVLKEFNVPGGTYYPGRELSLNAVLLDKWVLHGFVELIGEETAERKPEPERKKKPRKRRTVKTNTAVTG